MHIPKCLWSKTLYKIQETLFHVCFFIQIQTAAGFHNKQSPPVAEKMRWAVGGFRSRVRSSSVCGTVHGRWFLNRTHALCSPCPFHFSHFPNVPVCAPARLWGEEREVVRGERRHRKQPSTPWDNSSSQRATEASLKSIRMAPRRGLCWLHPGSDCNSEWQLNGPCSEIVLPVKPNMVSILSTKRKGQINANIIISM